MARLFAVVKPILEPLGSRQLAGSLLTALLVIGCGPDGIRTYRIPKETPPPAAAPATHADHAGPGRQMEWETPAGWQAIPPGQFRLASFRVTDGDARPADVSIVPLEGQAGGDLGNVNRWRAQVGQPPVSAAELSGLAHVLAVAGQPAALYEQEGNNAAGERIRILAAIQHREGTAWFYKMTGDSELVARQKPVFIAFLKSVRFMPAGDH
ncbi:hypothetical protein HQ590_12280 [bacterium]|nr:hypothetical protein [bacterium]